EPLIHRWPRRLQTPGDVTLPMPIGVHQHDPRPRRDRTIIRIRTQHRLQLGSILLRKIHSIMISQTTLYVKRNISFDTSSTIRRDPPAAEPAGGHPRPRARPGTP